MSTGRDTTNYFGSALDLRKVLSTSPPPLAHVLPGLLEATVGMVAATGGTGKTTFFLQLGMAAALGGPLCGGLFDDVSPDCARPTEPGRVVFVAAEESANLMAHRLHAAAADAFSSDYPLLDLTERMAMLDLLAANLRVFPMLGKPRTLLIDEEHEPTEAFLQLEEACKGASLVLLDPIRQFHRGDENDSWNMTAVVQTLQRLASRTGAAVLLAHHTNRASTNMGTAETAGAARGSTALTDGVRWQLNLSRPGRAFCDAYGLRAGEESGYVRADISKANYLAPCRPVLLQRMHGGALRLVRPLVAARGMYKPTAAKRGPARAKSVQAS